MDLSFLQNLPHFTGTVYAVLFFGMFVEANATVLGGTILLAHKILSPGLIFFLVVAGAFGEQYLLFWLGSRLAKKDSLANYINKTVARYDSHFTEKTFRSLFISKFIYGLHRVVLLRCGMLDISPRQFTRATLKSTSAWLVVMFILGYILSVSYKALLAFLKYGEIALLVVVALILLLQYFISKYLEKDL
jgi:membrane protein DedA with SNARE-associated domain